MNRRRSMIIGFERYIVLIGVVCFMALPAFLEMKETHHKSR